MPLPPNRLDRLFISGVLIDMYSSMRWREVAALLDFD
jgi:hypothetical protein